MVLKSRKCFTLIYTLNVDDNKVRVCKTFFLDTLDITGRPHWTQFIPLVKPEKRKGHTARKLSSVIKANMVEHIKKFPKISSYYGRWEGSKQYLDEGINISEMYLLYQLCCQEHEIVDRGEQWEYRKVLHSEFNIASNGSVSKL